MKYKQHNYDTLSDEKILEIVNKYEYRYEFKKEEKQLYNWLSKHKQPVSYYTKELKSTCKGSNNTYTDKELIDILHSYSSLKELKRHTHVEGTIRQRGMLEDYKFPKETDDLKEYKDTGYFVNKDGACYNSLGKLLKPIKNPNGYYKYCFCINKKVKQLTIHRLVIEVFVGEIPKNLEVNHKDFDRSNNSLDNLELLSRQDNIAYSMERIINSKRVLSDEQIIEFKNNISITKKPNYKQYMEKFNVSYCVLWSIAKGKTFKDVI